MGNRNMRRSVNNFRILHKRSLYEEIYDMLNPTGIFCNLEHVASPSVEHHLSFLHAIGYTPLMEDKSNR
jgi:tRNA (cmo5U34)-methyltransferase